MMVSSPPQTGYRVITHAAGSDPQIAYTLFEPTSPVSDLTLVLLHGAAHDERCWQQGWTDSLVQQGWRCLTLSYRGHGGSIWSRPVHQATLDDYVADVEEVLAGEGLDSRQVVLVGHSLGGGVAQCFAVQHEVAGLVLLASLALGRWMQEVLPRMPGHIVRHPRVYPRLRTDPSALFQTESLAREFLFGKETPAALVQWYLHECWCHESGAAMTDMIQAQPQPLRASHIYLIAGRQDASVSLRSMRRSAARLHAPLVEVEAPHDAMLAGDWRRVADMVMAFAQQVSDSLMWQNKEASYA